ncbi:MAG TPA: transglycosylase domain-containing protein [Actinocatenispora sp.]
MIARRVRHVRRWRRWVAGAGALVVLVALGAVGYVLSVPLPDEPAQPQESVLYYSDGHTVLARLGVVNRTKVRLSAVPVAVRHAVLAAEDRTFYRHGGVSVRGIFRSVWADVTADEAQGASTITQQYVRNAYLTQDRTVSRKAREAALSIKLERRYDKDQIFERYLNTIYFGRGAYGIDAAARAYFGVPVERLSLAQGTVLAAAVKDPTNFDPAVDAAAARQRFRYVLAGMRAMNWLAGAAPRYPRTVPPPRATGADRDPTSLVVGYVEQELAAAGISAQRLRTAGLRVVTTIDRDDQRAVVTEVRRQLSGQPAELRAAVVAVDPRTGAVRAYYGNDRGYGYYDDAAAARPPMGAFAPVAVVAAVDAGLDPDQSVDGSSPQRFGDRTGRLYNPGDAQCSPCSARTALYGDLPTARYRIAETVGPDRIAALAHAAGVASRYAGAPSLLDPPHTRYAGRTTGAVALGEYPVSPADLASVYATIAAAGRAYPRHVVQQVRAADGASLFTAHPQGHQAMRTAAVASLLPVFTEHGAAVAWVGADGSEPWGARGQVHSVWSATAMPDLATVAWVGREDAGPVRDDAGHALGADLTRALTEATLGAPTRLPRQADVG